MRDADTAGDGHAGRSRRALTAERLSAQLLAGPVAERLEDAVARLLAVQAQDGRGMRLSIRARAAGVVAADVDAALTSRRSLVVSWLNRGTLQLVRAEDYWWLHALTTPQQAPANRRRLAQEGVDAAAVERAMEVIGEQTRRGPRSRAELRAALAGAEVPTGGQALYHLLLAASLRGLSVQGPAREGELCFAATCDWLGAPPPPLPPAEALARLARRYLAGHGPADAGDLAAWAGIRLTDARVGLVGLADALVERPDGLLDLAGRSAAADLPAPKLLGPFDPLLHGWVSRGFLLGPHQCAVTRGGMFSPFALVDGRAVATWGLSGGRVTIRPLEPMPTTVGQQLYEEAAHVQRYLGVPVTAPRVVPAGS
jgi:hypothetical protein